MDEIITFEVPAFDTHDPNSPPVPLGQRVVRITSVWLVGKRFPLHVPPPEWVEPPSRSSEPEASAATLEEDCDPFITITFA